MSKKKIIELFKAGYTVRSISKTMDITRGYIGRVLCKSELDLPKCKICGRKILSLNQAHLNIHNFSMADYLRRFPKERKHVKYITWNKGLTAQTNSSIAKYTKAVKQRMRSQNERNKRSNINKLMWRAGKFKPNRDSYLKANRAWVRRIKSVSPEERKRLLFNFISSGNNAQRKLRERHKLDLDFFKRKYPRSINPRIITCMYCNSQYIKCNSNAKASNFCSPICYFNFIKSIDNPNYFINDDLRHRLITVHCRGCQINFIATSKRKVFCSSICRARWLKDNPNYTIKKRYYSEKFGIEYVYDSSYELDFIKWCEYCDRVVVLERNRPIIYIGMQRYFPDFLINGSIIVEIKADCLVIYDLERELKKINAGLCESLYYKLITNCELYIGKSINSKRLEQIVFLEEDFIGGRWKCEILKKSK